MNPINQAQSFEALVAKVDRMAADVAMLAEQSRRQQELIDEMVPIAKAMLTVASERLASLEQRGYFRFGNATLELLDRVVTSYGEDDVKALADNVVGILDTVRTLTQPEVLKIASDATTVVAERDSLEPLGVVGMVKATRDEEVQRGLAVMIELLRHVGRAADVYEKARKAPRTPRPASRPPAAPERPAAAAPSKHKGLGALAPKRPREDRPAAGPACARPVAPGPAVTQIDGVGFTADGFLADPKQWNKTLAVALAESAGVAEMTELHWKVVEFARAEYLETSVSPNIRRLSTGAGVSTKDIYSLFKKAPGKTVARIAGIPKPAGCI